MEVDNGKIQIKFEGIFKDREERNNFNVALLGFKMGVNDLINCI